MTNSTVDPQLCAVILHGLVLIINENQKGKECIQQKENMANWWSSGTESLFPFFPSGNNGCGRVQAQHGCCGLAYTGSF